MLGFSLMKRAPFALRVMLGPAFVPATVLAPPLALPLGDLCRWVDLKPSH